MAGGDFKNYIDILVRLKSDASGLTSINNALKITNRYLLFGLASICFLFLLPQGLRIEPDD